MDKILGGGIESMSITEVISHLLLDDVIQYESYCMTHTTHMPRKSIEIDSHSFTKKIRFLVNFEQEKLKSLIQFV